MKVFNFDQHPSVIKDVRNVIGTLYGERVQITSWCVDSHPPDCDIINFENWQHFDHQTIVAFQNKHDAFLRTFDMFVVTHQIAFTMLYEKYGKPVLIVNSWRYEMPLGLYSHHVWPDLNRVLQRMHQRGQLIAVSNNRADMLYMLVGSGVKSTHIPSLGLYTGFVHRPQRQELVLYRGDRALFPPSPKLVAHVNMMYYDQLYAFKAIVHLPYEISTMSIFEQVIAGVPLFFPTKRFYKECIKSGLAVCKSRYASAPRPKALFAFFESLDVWLDNADYYTQRQPFAHKFVYYYDSFSDMIAQAETFEETPDIVQARAEWIFLRKETILNEWKRLLDPVILGPVV